MRHVRIHNRWREETWGIRQLREMLVHIGMQNEMILAKLDGRPSKLTLEEQTQVNELFGVSEEIDKLLDEAIKK